MTGDPSLARALGMSNAAWASQMNAMTRALRLVPKVDVPTFADLMPNVSALMPKFEALAVTASMPNLSALMPKVPVPDVGAVWPRLSEIMPKIAVPDVGAVWPRLADITPRVPTTRFADLFPVMPRFDVLVPQWTKVQDWIGDILKSWRDLAETGRAWARQALRAAMAAKQAVLHGRWEEVKAFVREWLDLRHPEDAHVQAAADALLEPAWASTEPPDLTIAWDLLDELRAQTLAGARRHRPISHTQINGVRVTHLEQPLRGGDGTTTLLDLVVDRPTSDSTDWGFTDDRLNRVFALMTPEEREVCLAHTGGPGCTWADAALAAGFPAEFGETVRRKRVRLVAEVSRRASARRAEHTSTGRR